MSEEHCSVITTGETEQSGSLSWSFMQHELVDEAIRQATTKPRDWTRENTRNEVVWSPSLFTMLAFQLLLITTERTK